MKLEIFKDKKGQCRIRLRANNGRILMSSEAYSSKSKAMKTAMSIRKYIHVADWIPVDDLTKKA